MLSAARIEAETVAAYFRRSMVVETVLSCVWLAIALAADEGVSRILSFIVFALMLVLLATHFVFLRVRNWLEHERLGWVVLVETLALTGVILAHSIMATRGASKGLLKAFRVAFSFFALAVNCGKVRLHWRIVREIRHRTSTKGDLPDYVALAGGDETVSPVADEAD